MTRGSDGLLTVVSPLSLESWYRQFCGAMTNVVFVGEEGGDPVRLADQVCALAGSGHVRILSGHDSLVRDWVLAHELSSRGLAVFSQSGMASSAALDKVLQKQLLMFAGVQVPSWGPPDSRLPVGDRTLWKGRTSTQSRVIAWADPLQHAPVDSYWETYIGGVEYSVVVHREHGRIVRFPAVWKGAVRGDLSPPWRRLRLVPSGASAALLAEMDAIAVQIAELLDVWGFAEVEFIVTYDGTPLVTDINPRVCGTMRIVAMATNMPIFDPAALAPLTEPSAPRYAAEIPYSGPPFATPTVVATSRLTCSGSSPGEVFGTLAQWGFEPGPESLPRVWRAD